jgi:hypothetical protein
LAVERDRRGLLQNATLSEIYNYEVEQDSFYFADHLVDEKVASVAFKRFVNEALRYGSSVAIVKP